MTEWNQLNRRNRNNGATIRINLNITVWLIHLSKWDIHLVHTHPGVRVPPSLWHVSWSPSPPPPNCLSWLKERVIGESQTAGGRGEGWGVQWCCWSVFLLVSLQNHAIPLLILTVQLGLSKLPVPPICSQEKTSRSFWLCHEVSEGQMVPIHPSNEWTKGKEQSKKGKKKKKQPGLVCCECISWVAALRCAKSALASAGGRVM